MSNINSVALYIDWFNFIKSLFSDTTKQNIKFYSVSPIEAISKVYQHVVSKETVCRFYDYS